MSKASRKNPFLANRQPAARTANTRLCNGTTAADGKAVIGTGRRKSKCLCNGVGLWAIEFVTLSVGSPHTQHTANVAANVFCPFFEGLSSLFCVVIGRPQTCVALSQSQVLDCLGVAIFQTYAAPSCTVMMCEAEYVWFGNRTVIV